MTTKTIDDTTRLTILKHLAAGKSLDITATIVRHTRGDVLDIASNHGYPDTTKLGWAADVLERKLNDMDAPVEDPAREARIRTARALGDPTPGPTATTNTAPAHLPTPAAATIVTKPDEIRVLLNTAKSHPAKRIQNAADRVFDDLDKLRGLIAADEEKHAAAREAEKEKEKARAEVQRLQEQLAAAKAKLKAPAATAATSTSAAGDGPSAKTIRAWAKTAGVDCPATGRVPAAVRDAYDQAHPTDAEDIAS